MSSLLFVLPILSASLSYRVAVNALDAVDAVVVVPVVVVFAVVVSVAVAIVVLPRVWFPSLLISPLDFHDFLVFLLLFYAFLIS